MKTHIHILGICGTFMGGIAIIARQLGYRVTGSDHHIYPPMSEALAAHDIEIMPGYEKSHLQIKPDLVLFGNVCKRGMPIVEAVLDENIPFNSGPAWLSQQLLQKRHVLAVAGTHGKTTTTSLLAWILTFAGLKPGYLIGGVARNFSCTADVGESPYFVIEADEYDTAFFDKRPKFLHYFPKTLVLNNLEFDHADIYSNLAAIEQQFHYLMRTVPARGQILYSASDKNLQNVLARGVWSPALPFCGEEAEWRVELQQTDGSVFNVFYKNKLQGCVRWCLWGAHNIDNALGAIAAAFHVGVSPEIAVAALCEFQGIRRRLEVAAEVNGITIYDDFAHHPTAIAKTLRALRARVGEKPIIAVLQFASNTMSSGGHSDSDIAAALSEANQIILLNSPLNGRGVEALCQRIKSPTHVYPAVDDIVKHLKNILKSQDSVLIMSNKGFDGLQQKLLRSFDE